MKLPRTCFVSPFLSSFINYLLPYTRKVFSVPLILSPSDWLTGVAPDFHESSSVIHTRTVVVEKYVTQPAQTRVFLLPASLHRALDYVVVLSYQRHLRPPAIGTTTSTIFNAPNLSSYILQRIAGCIASRNGNNVTVMLRYRYSYRSIGKSN